MEIKEDSDAELPENLAPYALIHELLTEPGYRFRLWRRSEICAEPRLTNAGLILRYRCVEVPAVEQERIVLGHSHQQVADSSLQLRRSRNALRVTAGVFFDA